MTVDNALRFMMRADSCSVRGCTKPVKALGQCSRHYEQQRLHGRHHNRPPGVSATPAHERVLRRVRREAGCLVYTGAPNTRRPTVTIRPGFVQTVYQAVYEALVGPVPKGMVLHHTCENPRCVNVRHLRVMLNGRHTGLHKPRLGTGRKSTAR